MHLSRCFSRIPTPCVICGPLHVQQLHRSHLNPFLERYRRNSTATAQKKEYLCLLPDKPNVQEKRKKAKPFHYEGVQPFVAAGKLVVGGAMFEKHPAEGDHGVFMGSMVVYVAESAHEVWDIIKKDAYATNGVWDLEKAQVIPYVSAIREPIM